MSSSLKKMAADQAVEGVKKTDLFRVDPRLLKEEDGFNLRDYNAEETKASILSFKESYMQALYVPPLVVWVNNDDEVVIIEGHKRRRGALAAIKAGADLAYVDCVQFRGSEAERTELMLRSGEGQAFTPLQIAMGMLRLHRWGHTNAQIGKKTGGKTAQNVEQLLLLAMANADVHELVNSGAVAAYTAIDAIRAHGEKAGAFLAAHLEKAKSNGKTKVTKGAVNGWAPPKKIVSGLVTTVSTFAAGLGRDARHQLAQYEKLDPDRLKGKTIEVEASALISLLKAQGEIDDARKKFEGKTAANAAKASQQRLVA